jgi:hypothetical protein
MGRGDIARFSISMNYRSESENDYDGIRRYGLGVVVTIIDSPSFWRERRHDSLASRRPPDRGQSSRPGHKVSLWKSSFSSIPRAGPASWFRGMRERLRHLGGTLDIRTDSAGTAVTATLPLRDAVPDAGTGSNLASNISQPSESDNSLVCSASFPDSLCVKVFPFVIIFTHWLPISVRELRSSDPFSLSLFSLLFGSLCL